MDMMESTTPVTTYEREAAGETIMTECCVEHTLPDYLPEIRRLLRVSARPIATGRYLGDGHAEFAGIVAFTVVYTDEEGKPAALTLNGDYSVTVPYGEGAVSAAALTTEVESSVCRLGGPRRLSLRAGLRHTARITRTVPLPLPEAEGCECLVRRLPARRTMTAESGELAFSDGIAVGGIAPDGVKPLFCDGDLLIEECRVKEEGVSLRGTVNARVLLSEEGGRPMSFTARIPISCELEAEGAAVGDTCLPCGQVSTLNVRVTGDGEGGSRLELDGVAECRVRLVRNEEVAPTVGMYSPACRSEVTRAPLTVEAVAGAAAGHYTVSGKTAAGEERASLILDTAATATVRKVICEEGHPVVLGEVAAQLLLASAPDGEGRVACHAHEYRYPFRVVLPLGLSEGGDVRYECTCTAHAAQSRIEEGGYATDTELAVTLLALRGESVAAVTAVTLHPEERYPEREGLITVVYPEGGDTLFSLAERYHTTPAALAEGNHLPFTGNEEAALPTSLDGVAYLVIG